MRNAKRILVFEPEALTAQDILAQLEAMGCEGETYPVSRSSLDAALRSPAAAAIVDIDHASGDEALEVARALNRNFQTPVICLSALSDDSDLQRLLESEPAALLDKPFTSRELKAAIDLAIYKARMEEQLRESRQWFASTLRCIAQGVIATDLAGCVTFMNAVAESITGFSQSDAMGKSIESVLPLVDAQTAEPMAHPALEVLNQKSDTSLQTHGLLQRKDGSVRYISDTASAIRTEWSKLLGAVLIFSDVTERFRHSPHSFESESRQPSLAEASYRHTHDGVLLIDSENGLILDANPAMEQLFGYRLSELVGKHFSILLKEETAGENPLERLRTEGPVFVEQKMVDKSGERVFVDLSAAIVPFGGERAIIANLRNAEERAEHDRKNIKAIEAHRLQVNEMNHRVKNHLQTVSSLIRTRARSIDDASAHDSLLSCAGQIRAIALLHTEFSLGTHATDLELGQYLRRLAPFIVETSGSEKKGINLKVEVEGLVLPPHQATPAVLLVFEMLTNALRHAYPAEATTRRVEVRGGIRGNQQAWLEVEDWGVGFEDEAEAEGTGLTLISGLASQIGGKIQKSGPPGTLYKMEWDVQRPLNSGDNR